MHDPEAILKREKLKVTAPRLAILELLVREHGPFRTEEIRNRLKKKEIDVVTVYRTIATFENRGLVRKVDFGDGAARYEFQSEGSHHHHIICVSCRAHENLSDCLAEALEKEAKKRGYRRVSHSFEVFGVCPRCQRKETAAPR